MKAIKEHYIKISPEYGCFPIWTGDGDIYRYNEDIVIENTAIYNRLDEWNDVFQRTLDNSYPPDSRFESAQQLYNFETEGLAIWQHILSNFPNYKVVYESIVFDKLYENPESLSNDIENYDFNTSYWLSAKKY